MVFLQVNLKAFGLFSRLTLNTQAKTKTTNIFSFDYHIVVHNILYTLLTSGQTKSTWLYRAVSLRSPYSQSVHTVRWFFFCLQNCKEISVSLWQLVYHSNFTSNLLISQYSVQVICTDTRQRFIAFQMRCVFRSFACQQQVNEKITELFAEGVFVSVLYIWLLFGSGSMVFVLAILCCLYMF